MCSRCDMSYPADAVQRQLIRNPASNQRWRDWYRHELQHKLPHGKSSESADLVLVQRSSATLNQCRFSIIDMARDMMVEQDKLRVLTLSPSSFDHRLCSAIHPCSSASSVDNSTIRFSRPQHSTTTRTQHNQATEQKMRFTDAQNL